MEQRRSACDSCRRRRVKCDATQPCSPCTRSGIACTYGSVASRQSATSYARNLEQQVAELQLQLQALANSAAGPSGALHASGHPIDLLVGPGDDFVVQQDAGIRVYGYSATLNVLRVIADMLGSNPAMTPTPDSPGRALVKVLETPVDLPARSPLYWLDALLPSREKTWTIVAHALDWALICHDCIDRTAFQTRLDGLFELPRDASIAEHKSFLALVYALLALGELYYAAPYEGSHNLIDRQSLQPRGYVEDVATQTFNKNSDPSDRLTYFRASRCIVYEKHERYDLDTVTAIMLHSRYLHSTSTISDTHATLTSAISAAMYMGLHLDDSSLRASVTQAELNNRRRVFAVLNMMDTYLACPLGLPKTLAAASAKQTLGLADDDLVDEGQALILQNTTSPESETVLSQKLFRIQAKFLDYQTDRSAEATDWIPRIESDLEEWENNLPELPDRPANSRVLLGQLILRLHYTGTQIMLYAPCLHHLGRERSDPAFNLVGYQYGSTCVRAAAQATFLIESLYTHDILSEAHWMIRYILAWAATILAYFVLHSRTRVTIKESKTAALVANRMLETLATNNVAAKHIHECIAPYMEIVHSLRE